MVGDTSFKIKPRIGDYLLMHKNQGHLARNVLLAVPRPEAGQGRAGQTTMAATSRPRPHRARRPRRRVQRDVEGGDRRLHPLALQEARARVRRGRGHPHLDGASSKSDRGDWIFRDSGTACARASSRCRPRGPASPLSPGARRRGDCAAARGGGAGDRTTAPNPALTPTYKGSSLPRRAGAAGQDRQGALQPVQPSHASRCSWRTEAGYLAPVGPRPGEERHRQVRSTDRGRGGGRGLVGCLRGHSVPSTAAGRLLPGLASRTMLCMVNGIIARETRAVHRMAAARGGDAHAKRDLTRRSSTWRSAAIERYSYSRRRSIRITHSHTCNYSEWYYGYGGYRPCSCTRRCQMRTSATGPLSTD